MRPAVGFNDDIALLAVEFGEIVVGGGNDLNAGGAGLAVDPDPVSVGFNGYEDMLKAGSEEAREEFVDAQGLENDDGTGGHIV